MGLPTGPLVAFLFTDIEGSTRSERAVGSATWAAIAERHDLLLREAIETAGGAVVKTEGDAFFAAFGDPAAAVAAAIAAQRAVAHESWPAGLALRVRMGIHAGEGRLRSRRSGDEPEDYVGIDVNYAARIAAAANGGQIVLSDALVQAAGPGIEGGDGLREVHLVRVGLRAVKDFEEPAPLYRLVVPGAADDERPLRTSDVPTNLPGEVTPLVGREDEIERVLAELADRRIVTLAGPGGSGKTRLALAAARAGLPRFPHGAWFVDLAAVRDPGLVEGAIAVSMGVRESPERTVAEALGDHLRDRIALLVLDNVEQLLPGAADVIARLVRGAPEVRVLVTSRELLRIAGERAHPVPPLDVEAGIELFLDRARAHRSDLAETAELRQTIRAISERLGGLPLAIELAAARVRVTTPAAILERLGRSLDLGGGARDLPERQRTLRGTVAWSYDLLSSGERRLFARLGVFAGGWTAESASAVAESAGDLGIDVVEGLESLADKSLIRVEAAPSPVGTGAPGSSGDDEVRFSLQPLLREYALEKLGESGDRRHCEERFAIVCAAIAEAAGPAILGPQGEATLQRLDREAPNVRAAIDWAATNEQPELGLRILAAIWRWFHQRGRIREARELIERLLATPPSASAPVRVGALAALGGLAYWMNDFPASRAAYEERLSLATEIGDPSGIAGAHYDLGFIAMVDGDGAALQAHEQQALDLYTAVGDENAAIRARQALVLAVFLAGDYAAASALESANLAAFRRAGSLYQIADSLTLLSAVHWKRGENDLAWARLSEGLRLFADGDSASGLARNIAMASIILLSGGDPESGARLAGASYRLVREKGVMLAPVKVLHLRDPAELAAEVLGPDRAAELMAEGDALPIDEVVATIQAMSVPGVEGH